MLISRILEVKLENGKRIITKNKLANVGKLNKYHSEKIKFIVKMKRDRLYYVKLIFCYNFGIGG